MPVGTIPHRANALKSVVSTQMFYLWQSDGAAAVEPGAEDGHPAAKAHKTKWHTEEAIHAFSPAITQSQAEEVRQRITQSHTEEA
jgi:hypothetical protein